MTGCYVAHILFTVPIFSASSRLHDFSLYTTLLNFLICILIAEFKSNFKIVSQSNLLSVFKFHIKIHSGPPYSALSSAVWQWYSTMIWLIGFQHYCHQNISVSSTDKSDTAAKWTENGNVFRCWIGFHLELGT